jgi:MoaA/NifB/PqqE/SkfB family radical SAM enzyme
MNSGHFELRRLAGALLSVNSYRPGRRGTALQGPIQVQVQTVTGCNGHCTMCPASAGRTGAAGERMDARLYEHVLRQLRGAGTVRTLCLMLQNEPLLDPGLEERVRVASRVLPRRTARMVVTNGSLLDADRVRSLCEAGVTRVEVSIDAATEETYRKVRPGLSFQDVVQNTRRMVAMAPRGTVVARFLRVRENAHEEREFARRWRAHGADVQRRGVYNRAGALKHFGRVAAPHPLAFSDVLGAVLGRFYLACRMPFTALSVLCDGRVLLCCGDWRHREIMGDLSRQSLAEVWNGDAINHHRHLLWTGRTAESAVCRYCSVVRPYSEQRQVAHVDSLS